MNARVIWSHPCSLTWGFKAAWSMRIGDVELTGVAASVHTKAYSFMPKKESGQVSLYAPKARLFTGSQKRSYVISQSWQERGIAVTVFPNRRYPVQIWLWPSPKPRTLASLER